MQAFHQPLQTSQGDPRQDPESDESSPLQSAKTYFFSTQRGLLVCLPPTTVFHNDGRSHGSGPTSNADRRYVAVIYGGKWPFVLRLVPLRRKRSRKTYSSDNAMCSALYLARLLSSTELEGRTSFTSILCDHMRM